MKKSLEDLQSEFAVAENDPLTFDQLTPGRRKPVVWKCSQGHLYPARVHNKLKGTGCPYCNHRLPIPGETDFASQYPELAAEFDIDGNDGKKPEDFLPHCNDDFNWICKYGHKFRARMNNRVNNNSPCPCCAGVIPIPGENDAATRYPHLEKEYALDLNKGHSLSEYFSQSNEYAMWRCKEGHEWEARIDHRTAGQGCPYCEGKKVIPEETSFAAKHPKMAKRWHPTQNNGRQPYEFTEFSHFEAIWICPKGHEYPMPIYRKSRGCGCSVCAGKHVLAGYNDIESQAPHLALEWDDEHNEGIKSCEVALHSNERYNWKCTVCGHQWKTSPNNRAKGTGCPACKHCCVDPLVNSLAVVNPNLAKQWDNERNSPLTSLDVAGYDNRDYYWVCEKGHSWKASPANRNKGTGCPYCKRKKPIVGKTDLASQAPALSKMLHPTKNGKRTAVDYFVDYTRDIWWLCESGHSFRASPRSMVAGWRCKVCDPW